MVNNIAVSGTAGSPVYETIDSAGTSKSCALDPSNASSPSTSGYGGSPKSLDLEDAQGEQKKSVDGAAIPSASFAACNINLLKTIFGFGMLTLPSSLATVGYVPGLFFILLTGGLAAFGLHLFVVSSQHLGRGATVNKLALMTYPKLTILFDLAIAVKCLGVATSYLMAIANMSPQIMESINVPYTLLQSRNVWLLLAALILVPLAFLRRMDSLKYTSFFGLMSVLYVVVMAVWKAVGPGALRPPVGAEIQPFGKLSFGDMKASLDALRCFSVFVFSFTCHQNIFPIQREAVDNSPKFMNRVIAFSLILSGITYMAFSMAAYASIGRYVGSDFFKIRQDDDPLMAPSSYPQGLEVTIARILFVLLAVFSYPLQTLPCRNSLENILPLSKSAKASYSRAIHFGITSFILLCTFAITSQSKDIKVALQIVGTYAGLPICYILPFLLYYKLTEDHGWTWKRIGAALLATFGVLAMIVCTIPLVFPPKP